MHREYHILLRSRQATPFAGNKAKTLCPSDEIASKERLKRGIKINGRDVLHVCLIFTTIKENTNEDFKFCLK